MRGATSSRGSERFTAVLAAALLALSLGSAPSARAEEHDPDRGGHPLRVVAYALHPVGVVLDYVLVRPLHWLASHEPLRTLFGYEDD